MGAAKYTPLKRAGWTHADGRKYRLDSTLIQATVYDQKTPRATLKSAHCTVQILAKSMDRCFARAEEFAVEMTRDLKIPGAVEALKITLGLAAHKVGNE